MAFEQPKVTPTVWRWYVAYCLAMAALYLMVAIMGVGLLGVLALPISSEEYSPLEIKVQAALCIGLGLVLFTPFAVAPFLPKKPWVWIYGIVMIGIGMTSICCLPATVPLLIFWIKPETKQFFDPKPDGTTSAMNSTRNYTIP